MDKHNDKEPFNVGTRDLDKICVGDESWHIKCRRKRRVYPNKWRRGNGYIHDDNYGSMSISSSADVSEYIWHEY
jgi:hypothetical protein